MGIKNIDVYICWLFLFFTVGAFQIPGDGAISLVIWIVWLLAVLEKGGIRTLINRCGSNIICWLFVLFIVCFGMLCLWEENKILAIKNIMNYFLMFTPWIICCYYSASKKEEQVVLLLKGLKTIYLFWYMCACCYFIAHSGAAAEMAAGKYNHKIIALGGGQWLAYAACLHCVYLIYKILNIKRNTEDIFFIVMASMLILLTQSTITLLTLICGIGLCVLDYGIRMASKKAVWTVFCGSVVFLIIILAFFQQEIIEALYKKSQGWNLTNADKILIRLKQVAGILYGEKQSSATSSAQRIIAYEQSGGLFLNNIILGIGPEEGVLLSNGNLGNHSEILDALANWGVIIGGCYLCSYFGALFRKKNKGKLLVGITAVIMGCLNPMISFQVTAMILLLIPISANDMS